MILYSWVVGSVMPCYPSSKRPHRPPQKVWQLKYSNMGNMRPYFPPKMAKAFVPILRASYRTSLDTSGFPDIGSTWPRHLNTPLIHHSKIIFADSSRCNPYKSQRSFGVIATITCGKSEQIP